MGLQASDLAMLTMTASWAALTGEDAWGNNTYASAVPLACFVLPGTTSLVSGASQNIERDRIYQTELICDAVGVAPGDRITLPSGTIAYVSEVSTTQDEDGSDLLHEVTVTSTEGA
jgi:hypothetical protein